MYIYLTHYKLLTFVFAAEDSKDDNEIQENENNSSAANNDIRASIDSYSLEGKLPTSLLEYCN